MSIHPVPLLMEWMRTKRRLELWEKHLLLEGFIDGAMRGPTCLILCALLDGVGHDEIHAAALDLDKRLERDPSDGIEQLCQPVTETIQ